MSRMAKHIEMDYCDFCNGKVFPNCDGELECEKCATVFRAVNRGENDESDK